MEFDEQIDLSKRKVSSRLIVQRALIRGWHITGFKTNPAIFLINIPGIEKTIRVFSASPPQTSYPAVKISKDKFITNQILSHTGIKVPKELLIEEVDSDLKLAEEFIDNFGKVVVKPLDASHGNGISVNITKDTLKKAITYAASECNNPGILIQEQLKGIDIRIVCINYEFADAFSRIPANVTGDGIHSIKELIEITNSSEDRGENYKAKLNVIPLDKAADHLGLEEINSIPTDGDNIQVIGACNIGMGGERHNLKDDIPDFLEDIAIECAKELELPMCGVDFIVKRLPQKNDGPEDLVPYVIEVNECPTLNLYDDFDCKEQIEIVDRYLDFVASSTTK